MPSIFHWIVGYWVLELLVINFLRNCFLVLQAIDVLTPDYEPSDLDILYAEGVTSSSGLACLDFSFPQTASEENLDPSDHHDSLLR